MALPRAAWKRKRKKKKNHIIGIQGTQALEKKKKSSRDTEYFIAFQTPANILLIFLYDLCRESYHPFHK